MAVKLLAIDLDGTLTKKGTNVISERNRKAIEKAIEKGVKICIATGRTYKSAKAVQDILNLDTNMICFAGSMITDTDGNILYEDFLSKKDTYDLIEYANKNNKYCQIYKGDDVLYYKSNKEFDAFGDLYSKRTRLDVYEDTSILGDKNISSAKVLFMDKEKDIDQTIADLQKAFPHLSVKDSMIPFIEIMNVSATKGNGLAIVAKQLGIDMSQTMAIGDSGIDACMIEAAGIGVAMKESKQYIKDLADFVTLDMENDGFAYAVDKFCL